MKNPRERGREADVFARSGEVATGPDFAMRSRIRARIYARRERDFYQVGKFAKLFAKLLDTKFSFFAKKIRMTS